MPNGEYHQQYSPEVDNIVGSQCIENCLVGPCYDQEGKLRGVIQLINKKGADPITFQDEREFSELLPTMAEIIKQADQTKYVNDVCENINLKLVQSKESIFESSKVFDERNLTGIHAAFQQIVNRVENFSK